MIRTLSLLFIGVVLGWILRPSGASPEESGEVSGGLKGLATESTHKSIVEDLVEVPLARSNATPALQQLVDVRPPGQRTPEVPVFSDALLRVFHSGFLSAWKSERPDSPSTERVARAETGFREAVLALPGTLGITQAENLTSVEHGQEALERGDGLGLLNALSEKSWVPTPATLTQDLMDRVFVRKASAGVIGGADFIKDSKLELTAGTTLRFGAGLFVLDERRFRGKDDKDLPTDVTLIGAGMDATLLRLGDISIRGNAERLTIRNLTLDCGNDGLFDMRRGGLVCNMNNVRIVRFDAGHGGCTIFSARGGIFLNARNCKFTGGYGRSPNTWGADLWRGGGMVGRFENCHFEGLSIERDSKATLIYKNCRFNGYGPKLTLESSSHVQYEGCSVTDKSTVGDGSGVTRKNLADLFWQAK